MVTSEKVSSTIVERASFLVIISITIGVSFSNLVLHHLLPLIPLFLAGMMISAGLMISFRDYIRSGIKPSKISVIVSAQYILSVSIGFALALLFFFILLDEPNLALGQVLHASMPSEQTSPVWVRLAGGNVALGIVTLVISTLASPFASPALVFAFAGTWVQIDYTAFFISLILTVLIPVLVGSFLRSSKTETITKHDHLYPAMSTMFALPTVVIIGALACSFLSSQLMEVLSYAIIASSVHFGSTILIGLTIPKILRWHYPDMAVSVFNLSMKEFTVTLGVIAATGLNQEVGVPAALYGIMHMAAAPIIARYLRKRYSSTS
ncbi:MAG: bile acid:sodium symporter [Nitrososphaerales archaeon]